MTKRGLSIIRTDKRPITLRRLPDKREAEATQWHALSTHACYGVRDITITEATEKTRKADVAVVLHKLHIAFSCMFLLQIKQETLALQSARIARQGTVRADNTMARYNNSPRIQPVGISDGTHRPRTSEQSRLFRIGTCPAIRHIQQTAPHGLLECRSMPHQRQIEPAQAAGKISSQLPTDFLQTRSCTDRQGYWTFRRIAHHISKMQEMQTRTRNTGAHDTGRRIDKTSMTKRINHTIFPLLFPKNAKQINTYE